jgi:hypothetical protein
MSIEFPNSRLYPGHFKEKGYNALFINNAANCFAKNLRIINEGESMGCLVPPYGLPDGCVFEHRAWDVAARLQETCWQLGSKQAGRSAEKPLAATWNMLAACSETCRQLGTKEACSS